VVLSHDLWQRQFNGDSQIVGKTIPLSGNVYTVIGVMPAGIQIAQRKAGSLDAGAYFLIR
jgi:hypothetical protein